MNTPFSKVYNYVNAVNYMDEIAEAINKLADVLDKQLERFNDKLDLFTFGDRLALDGSGFR